MSEVAFQDPVQDSVPRINQDIAVGEDIEFQRRWWKFERAIWTIFTVIIVLTLAGVFGRGPLSKGRIVASGMSVEYERVARTGTPCEMRISFEPAAIQQGKLTLYVSESVVRTLGARRVIPSPATSQIGAGGITYTFPASTTPAVVSFALQPDGPGITHFTLQVAGQPPVHGRVITIP